MVAAGGGSRFGAAKQFTRLGDVSVLDRAVGVAGSACDGVVVVLPAGSDWNAPAGVRVATGGDTRSASVRSGLAQVPDDADVVVVHDAARPLATAALFARVVAAVRAGADAAVPATAGDRHGEAGARRAGDRDGAARRPRRRPDAAGVPTHRVDAGAMRAAAVGTDDAALVEAAGGTVVVVEGEPRNLKVTVAGDIELARALIEGAHA